TEHADSPYVAGMSFENVDVGRVIREAMEHKSQMSASQVGKVDSNRQNVEEEPNWQITGMLSGRLDIYGNTRDNKSIGGSGQLVLRNGQMQHEIFQIIGQ